MTVIIGMAQEGKAYMGADSCSGDGWTLRAMSTPKMFKMDEMVIGFTTSWRMGQILQYHLTLPEREEKETDNHYIYAKWIESVRDVFKEHGFGATDSKGDTGGDFILGYRGHIYRVQSDYSIIQPLNNVVACGIGEQVALGAMLALENLEPEARIKRSLEIVGSLSDGVLPPYHLEQVE